MRTGYKFKSSRLQVSHKDICSENFGRFSQKYPWWGHVLIEIARSLIVLKQDSTASFFLGIFQNL